MNKHLPKGVIISCFVAIGIIVIAILMQYKNQQTLIKDQEIWRWDNEQNAVLQPTPTIEVTKTDTQTAVAIDLTHGYKLNPSVVQRFTQTQTRTITGIKIKFVTTSKTNLSVDVNLEGQKTKMATKTITVEENQAPGWQEIRWSKPITLEKDQTYVLNIEAKNCEVGYANSDVVPMSNMLVKTENGWEDRKNWDIIYAWLEG